MSARQHDVSAPRILCVDDEPAVLEGLALQLRRVRREGVRAVVEVATSAREALALLEATEFDVVVCDMRMPETNGAALLGEVRRRHPDTERVLLTGHADLQETAAAVNEGGVFQVLFKPCPGEELRAAVEEGLERRARRREESRKLAERDALHGQLLDAARLASLGTLAGSVGHEVNNLLAVLESARWELEEGLRTSRPPDAELVEDLEVVSTHLRSHARNLLDLGRPSRDSEACCDAADIARKTLRRLETSGVTKRIRVTLEAEHGIVPIAPTRLEQVLLNLVKNAAHAVENARRTDVVVRVVREAEHVRVEVEDEGNGIPEGAMPKLFEAFYTTKPDDVGTGLGLPIVKRIVEEAGGTIGVESEPGVGARFTLRLPRRLLDDRAHAAE